MRRIVFILFLVSFCSYSQTFHSNKYGFSTGVVLNFGSHVNSIGVVAKVFYTDYFYQVNLGSSLTWNLKSYGSRKKFWESRNYLGILFLGGKKDNTIDFQLDGLLHQTIFRNAIGYNYLWYFDNSGTSQRSGGWGLNINKLGVYFENDLFGGQGKDRFRTGHILVSYRFQKYKFATGIYLWTGETNGTPWIKVGSQKCPNGYKDLSDLPYGKTSHGIVYGSVFYNLSYGQTAHLKIGGDSDNIRNVIQNKLIHDLIFLPKKIERKTPHYPRLSKEGLPVFEKNKVKPNKIFMQAGFNEFM